MTPPRIYEDLPFVWTDPEIGQSDRRWLESVIQNAAPYSDWWVKARIVQTAYTALQVDQRIYAGKSSEAEIATVLRDQVDPELYPACFHALTETYVIEVLNAWKSKQFSQAISRNFEVYADRNHANVFLVVSTAPVSLEVDRVLPPLKRFRPLFNVRELAQIMAQRQVQRVTLRTHGYSNEARGFYQRFGKEAQELNQPDRTTQTRPLDDDHFYIGYHWPSEQPVTSPGLWSDYHTHPGVVLKFLFVLSGLAGIVGTLLWFLLRVLGVPLLEILGTLPGIAQAWQWLQFSATAALAVQWYWIVPTLFMFWLLAFLLLRIVVYQRDRYRAIHYGAPDLAEFFWRVDKEIGQEYTRQPPQLLLNLIGHSMGGLVLVNVLRILSEYGRDDQGTLNPDSMLPTDLVEENRVGQHWILDKLILASPDIPLEFMREGRNNYVRSAMRRCRRIYLMSSDRDIVLRYLATLGNWFSEPSIQMAGLRLGNVYLKSVLDKQGNRVYRPYVRVMLHSERAVQPTSAYDLFRKFNYLDCSEMGADTGKGGVNIVPLALNHITAIPIDLLNTLFFLPPFSLIDTHGGYFHTNTRSFQLLKFLLTANFLPDEVIRTKITELIADSPIRFLPSQPWEMAAASKNQVASR